MDGRRAWWGALGAATVIAVVLRLPMLTQPMTADEGGYAGVARGWAGGARLYRDVWVDRPQGLLVLYRFVDWVDGGHAVGIRIMAVVLGVGLVWATAWAARGLAGDGAGAVAALVCAAATSVPTLEGFAANGELLAGAFAALCVALAVAATRRDGWWRWLAAGLAGGAAISLKQSGFDGLAAVGLWLAVVAVFGPGRRIAVRRLGLVAAGAAAPLVATAVHGALTGWDRWVAAMGSYRLRAQSAVSAGDWENLVRTGRVAAPVLGLVVVAALVGLVLGPWLVGRRAALLWIVPAAWLSFAALAFLAGGGFWRHYWIQLGAPLATLAGIGVAGLVRAPHRRMLLAAALAAPAVLVTGWVVSAPRDEWIVRANDDWRSPLDAEVARWLRANDVDHGAVYVLCASAGLYGDAPITPGYPYLWMIEVHEAPGAQSRLLRYLSDPATAPEYLAQFQTAADCDPSGELAHVVDASYDSVATIGPVAILRRDPSSKSFVSRP